MAMNLNLRHTLAAALLLMLCTPVAALDEERRVFMAYDASNGLADNSSQIVLSTFTGRILVTTLGHVNFFDGASFSHIDPQSTDTYPLPGYQQDRYQIYFDRFHHLWIKNAGQISCVDLTTERFVNHVPDVFRQAGVTRPVDDIFGDGESHVWFRTADELYNPTLEKSFRIQGSSPLQDVDLYDDRVLLMFHADGSVGVYDYETQRFLYRDAAFEGLERDLYGLSSEICLVGNRYYQLRNGVYDAVLLSYDVDQRRWTTVLKRPFRLNALYPMGDQVYIGSERGYLVYDMTTGHTTHYETLRLTRGRTQQARINSLCFDRQGGLWIATEQRGLLFSKGLESPFRSYLWSTPEALRLSQSLDAALAGRRQLPRNTNCILEDSRGWRWTGSYNGLEVEMSDGAKRIFTTLDGLPNQAVHSIVEDADGNIWVGLSYGLAHLIVRDGRVVHLEPYINQDNIPNETFMNGRARCLKDGRIAMQTIDHMVVFNPRDVQYERLASTPIYPKLVQLMVNGSEVRPCEELDGTVVIRKALSRADSIWLNYRQNSLTMHFSGLNYLRPLQTYFRVRVKGVTGYNDWRTLSYGKSEGMVDRHGQLRLMLLALEPGTYDVEVQTSMWPENWSEKPYVWHVVVMQPWWRTTGVYYLAGLLLVVLLVLNFLAFTRNMHLRMRRNTEEADITRRIRNYAMRCLSLSHEPLSPVTTTAHGDQTAGDPADDAFVGIMLQLVPYVQSCGDRPFTISELAAQADVRPADLYTMFSSQLDKSPRLLLLPLRLKEAERLLRQTDDSVETIARQLHFSSANFLIASFYHRYRQTPLAYRNQHRDGQQGR